MDECIIITAGQTTAVIRGAFLFERAHVSE